MRNRSTGAVLLFLLLGACQTGFESSSVVIDLRVLGVQAEPPEVVLDVDPMRPEAVELPPVELVAIIADPGEERRLDWGMTVCPPTLSLRCDDPLASYVAAGSGTVDDPEQSGALPPRGVAQLTPQLLMESVRLDALAGFGGIAVQVELWVKPEGAAIATAAFASKRILFAPREPAERIANTNPSMTGLLVNAEPWDGAPCGDDAAGAPLAVTPGQMLVLEPVEADGAREPYVVPTFDGGVERFTELLFYSWFATAGQFAPDQSGGGPDLFGNVPTLGTEWTAPETEGPVRLWVVQRDERGGASFTVRCIAVGTTP